MSNSNAQPNNSNFIESGVKKAQEAFLDGAEQTNKSYAKTAGSELQKGNGATMAQYRTNKKNIEAARKNL